MWHELDAGGHGLDDFVARFAIWSLGQGGVFDRVRFGHVQLGSGFEIAGLNYLN